MSKSITEVDSLIDWLTIKTEITRYSDGALCTIEDRIVREGRANIYVNGKLLISLMYTPQHNEELAAGYLFSEGLIKSLQDIIGIKINNGDIFVSLHETTRQEHSGRLRSTAGGSGFADTNSQTLPKAASTLRLRPKDITDLMEKFSNRSDLFKKTGAVHSCALEFPGGSLFFEDVGRHNAIDKIVGAAVLQNIDPRDAILIISGRVSSEIMIKTAKLGVSVILSRASPMDAAVTMARSLNITLAGFARGTRFNIYSGSFRVAD